MPLLPRPCPLPLTSAGAAHSTCNWQSPKAFLVEMLPVPLTVATPSFTSHFAGPALSLCHWDKSLPPKRTIASEGGGPASTIFGSSLGGGISASGAGELFSGPAAIGTLVPPVSTFSAAKLTKATPTKHNAKRVFISDRITELKKFAIQKVGR